jgi:hypothetical protein
MGLPLEVFLIPNLALFFGNSSSSSAQETTVDATARRFFMLIIFPMLQSDMFHPSLIVWENVSDAISLRRQMSLVHIIISLLLLLDGIQDTSISVG